MWDTGAKHRRTENPSEASGGARSALTESSHGSLQTELQEMRVGSLPPAEKTPARCSGARPGGLALTPCASYDTRSPKVSRAACIPQYCPKPRLPSAAKTCIGLQLKSMHLFQFLLN